jgi:simple sugar transport system ATP-binding protein
MTADCDAPGLARAMVGRPVTLRSERAALGLAAAEIEAGAASTDGRAALMAALELADVCADAPDGRTLLDHLSLTVAAGEIVGVAGVEGNGQRPLGDLLSSLVHIRSGEIKVNGTSVRAGAPGAMSDAGIAIVPEDRHDSGCVLEMTIAENLFLSDPHMMARWGVLDRRRMNERAEELIERFSISCPGPEAPMWSLSGGNQQRVILARELAHDPTVLVAAQPTRGLDVGAIEYMSEQLRSAAAEGVAVLLISTELEEILDLAHRIVVISRGRIVGEMARTEVDLERLGLLMGGADDKAHATSGGAR